MCPGLECTHEIHDFPPSVVCAVSPMGEAIGELQADGEWLVLGVKG